MLPFTTEQFLAVFSAYGHATWPLQLAALLLGVVAVAVLAVPGRRSDRIVLLILAVMWAMAGIGYHLLFFTRINTAAYGFALLFIMQALAFAFAALTDRGPRFGCPKGTSFVLGAGLAAYALVAYPLIGLALGHAYLELPAFGITPCPVVLFTFGLLLLTMSHVPAWLLVVPFVWSLIGGTAAFLLNVPQDWVLLFSGVASILVLYFRSTPVNNAAANLDI